MARPGLHAEKSQSLLCSWCNLCTTTLKASMKKSATYTTLVIARKTPLTRENISETFWCYLRVNWFLAKIKAFQEWNVFFRIQITEELLWSVLKNHGKLQNIFYHFSSFLIHWPYCCFCDEASWEWKRPTRTKWSLNGTYLPSSNTKHHYVTFPCALCG